MNPALLQAQGLVKRFGGLLATDHCNLEVARGEIHALIGPNGAGKTTLLAQLSGELAPDSGRILFDGKDITRLPIHKRVAAGWRAPSRSPSSSNACRYARTWPLPCRRAAATPSICWARLPTKRRSTRGCGDCRKSRARRRFRAGGGDAVARPPAPARTRHGAGLRAAAAAARRADGRHRPRGVPADGKLILSLRGHCTFILVEHDMDAVFRLADRVSVLVAGSVIASGTVDEIRSDPQVIAAYLGDDHDAGAAA